MENHEQLFVSIGSKKDFNEPNNKKLFIRTEVLNIE